MDNPREVEALGRIYPEIIKPAFEKLRSQLDSNTHPVTIVFVDAYLERMDTFYHAGSKGADERLVCELKELEPLLFTEPEISARAAFGGPLYPMMLDAGYSPLETYDTLERERKAKRGRGREVDLSIEALEMQLAGRSLNEIADHQEGKVSNNLSKDRLAIERERRKQLISKRIKTIEPIYEKYRK